MASVGYENTIETAIPQTELYNIVKNHFESPLADGKTEKKAIIIGYDGCRADVLTEMVDGNSALTISATNTADKKASLTIGMAWSTF